MVNFKIYRLCFCGFNLKSISGQKTYSTLREKPRINHSKMAYFLDPVNHFQDIADDHKYETNISSPKISEFRQSFTKLRNQHKESKGNKDNKNTNSSEYDNLSMRMNWSDDWNLSMTKKNSINMDLYENYDIKKKKERPHTYSVSDHISQMSTWQNSLISEFGMLPTLPCISYFSVVDSSDDECSDISCDESIMSTCNLHSTFNDNMSHIMFSDMNTTDVLLRIPLFNSIGFPEIMSSILSNSSEYFKTAAPLRYNDIKSSKTAISSKYNSFETITSKKRFKFKFPKIKHSQKYNEDDFTEIIVPEKHNNMDSPKIKIVSRFPDDNIKSNHTINPDSNIKLDIISAKKKKLKQNISSVSNIKQDNIVKNKNFFKKFILKTPLKKTKVFKNKATQTYISVFNDVLFKESRASTKGLLYSQDIFQGNNYNLNKNMGIYYEHKDIYSNTKAAFSPSDSSSLTPKYVLSRSGKLKKTPLSRNITSDADISEYYESSKQSKCYCTCTCLCGACCTFSGTKHVLKRPSSVVFVEIAASRRADSSDTIDFNGDFDDKTAPNTNLTHISNNLSINQKELEFNALTLKLTHNDDLKLDSKLNNHYFEHQLDKNDCHSDSEFISNSIIDSYDILSPKLNNN
ncbi:hypothetical protein PNEG_00941 [Pneumocystis murina B123]|uniref:Uncharacterized protein n=1 Tax=Pneumocystis murina (strain B123) TaxID=1069680 RepID=M7NQ23_PNEMU|nr:hypothetical protein PNEG_00941 [Pneumocystis murina B123]EMR10793.1 hypothetical protein PNEG_00941 [Pneumocystis murina B123]